MASITRDLPEELRRETGKSWPRPTGNGWSFMHSVDHHITHPSDGPAAADDRQEGLKDDGGLPNGPSFIFVIAPSIRR